MASSSVVRDKLRIGAVSYLNTKPLVYRLGDFARDAELIFDVPSRLADRLARSDLDVALIPSIEAFRNPGYSIVSDACIACRGPVMSVKLLSRVPIPQIRSIALDEGSRTSVALVRILLLRRHGVAPEVRPLPLDGSVADMETDAVLLIGDRAIHAPDRVFVDQWDVGEQWCRWTGLPFVFAMWTAREGVDTSRVESALSAARDAGIENLETIAELEAPVVGLPVDACLAYLRDNLHFVLGIREQRGLHCFCRHAANLGLISLELTFESLGLTAS